MESVELAATVRVLGAAARVMGLEVPGFRSPPKVPGVTRTFRRREDGSSVVAVVVKGRSDVDVTADLIEGFLVANRLTGAAATRARTKLWSEWKRSALSA